MRSVFSASGCGSDSTSESKSGFRFGRCQRQPSAAIFLLSFLILEVATFQQNIGRIGYFWHIDSLHFDANFTLYGDRNNYCWEDFKSTSQIRPQGRLGDYHCDSSADLINSVFHFMKTKMGDKVDFIIWTGNSVPQSPNFPSSNLSARFDVLSKVTEMIQLTFPFTTVYPVLGNLDVVPFYRGVHSLSSSTAHSHGVGNSWRNSNSNNRRKGWRHGEEGHLHDAASASHSRKSTYEFVSNLWENWLPPTAVDTLKEGGYYQIEIARSKIRLVALNMNLYLEEVVEESKFYAHLHRQKSAEAQKSFASTASQSDPEDQWSWLLKVMEEAKKKGQNVIIFGHSPPGKSERSWQLQNSPGDRRKLDGQHWLQDKFNRRFLELVRRYSDIIVGQFFGHQHSDTFRIFRDGAGKPVSWALLNPSVSPFKVSANGLQVESSNPAVRLYRYDSYTGEVFDYAQFYLNLEEASRRDSSGVGQDQNPVDNSGSPLSNLFHSGQTSGSDLWKMEYNFSTMYNLPDISVATLESLSRQLRTNRSWFDAYYRANMVGYGSPWTCSEECRQSQICTISNIDYADYQYCIENKGVDLKTSFDLASSSTASGATESRLKSNPALEILLLGFAYFAIKLKYNFGC